MLATKNWETGRRAMQSKVRDLEARLIQASSAVECLALLLELADAHCAAFRGREGVRCAREALNIARVRGDHGSVARAHAAAARCHYQRADYVSAVAAGLEAMDAYGESDLQGRSEALQLLAQALMAIESFDLAEEVAQRAAEDALRGGNPTAEAGARSIWGAILIQRDRFGAARRQFREAGAIQRKLGDKLMLKRSAANIAKGYCRQANECDLRGDIPEARMLWRQAIRVYKVAIATGSLYAEDALAHAAIAECECRLGNPEAALKAIGPALELAVKSASPLVIAHCHLWESHAYRALDKLHDARRACSSARDAAEQFQHASILPECLKAESRLNDLEGRFESAQDLELRAERVNIEREAFFSRIRDDVARLWVKHAAARDHQPEVSLQGAA
jgi:tetratricopeptide (TPR) repeat protein